MAHARQQIREAVVTEVTGLATTGANVYDSRVYPYDTLPCLSVYAVSETITDEHATLGKRIRREVTIAVEARAKPAAGGATLEDQLDTICAEVEAGLADDPRLGNKAEYMELTGTEIELSGDQERPVGVARMFWRIVYRTLADDAETIVAT